MSRHAVHTALLAVSLASSSVAASQIAAPRLWAVPGLYGLERSACGRHDSAGGNGERDGAMIAPIFCDQLDLPRRQAIGQRFTAALSRHFPNVESRFGESLPADATPRARMASTLIASLRLTRATAWHVVKPAGVDGFLPITLTLDITNAATGEVVFTRTRSEVAQGTFASGDVENGLRAQFSGRLDATMHALVAAAAADWKPWAQQATVAGEASGQWIVDRGRSHGLRVGDAIGADGQVTFAGAGYAIVKPSLERYRPGQVLTRTAVAPAALLAKPSILTVMNDLPDGYAAPYLAEIFEDALGTRGGFAPVPVNPSFVNLRQMALGEAQAPAIESRSLPDYVASINVAALAPATYASNLPGVSVERHEAHAFVSLVDRSGRVVATFHGVGRIVDEVSGAIRFSAEQRRDTVVRNALIHAATQLARFRPRPLMLPIVAQDKAYLVRDPGGAVPLGSQLIVLREAEGMKGIEEPVFLPIGEVVTSELADGGLLAIDAGVVPLSLRGEEMVAVDQAGPSFVSRRSIDQCTGAGGVRRIDDRGQVAMPLWALAAETSFAGHYPGPVFISGMSARLAHYGVDFSGWDQFAPARPRAVDTCFMPVIAVAPAESQYSLTVGYTLMQGEKKLSGSGLKTTLTPTRLPAGTSPGDVEAMLQQDLAAHVLPLAEKAAATLRPES